MGLALFLSVGLIACGGKADAPGAQATGLTLPDVRALQPVPESPPPASVTGMSRPSG